MAAYLPVEAIAYLHRLDPIFPQPSPKDFFEVEPEQRLLWRIHGMGALESKDDEFLELRTSLAARAVLASLAAEGVPFIFLARQEHGKTNLYAGTYTTSDSALESRQARQLFETVYAATHRDIALEFNPPLPDLSQLSEVGIALGLPALTDNPVEILQPFDELTPWDKLLRSCSRQEWAILILAEPLVNNSAMKMIDMILRERTALRSRELELGRTDPISEHYDELLEAKIEIFIKGLNQGLWGVATYILGNRESYHGVAASLCGVHGGGSSVEPIRVHRLPADMAQLAYRYAALNSPGVQGTGIYRHPWAFRSVMNSDHLARLVQLPHREIPGFVITPKAEFKANLRSDHNSDRLLRLGYLWDGNHRLGDVLSISLDRTPQHIGIFGLPGSGKSVTISNITRQLDAHQIPYLIIEPTKREHRYYVIDSLGDKAQILTFGEEVGPARLNPLEIREGVRVQTHAARLINAFLHAFPWYGPTAYIFERAIYRTYELKGWNLVTGEHELGYGSHPYFQPTLRDLRKVVTELVESSQYEPKTKQDILGAILTRLESLLAGGKGLVLDCYTGISWEDIYTKPVVVELDSIGDAATKALLVALLVIDSTEYREVSGYFMQDTVRHVTILEEGHVLLPAISLSSNMEVAESKGFAVESIVNLLAEQRAYGEMFIIADQLPSRLAPAAVKLVAVKIAHQQVDAQDRNILAGSMNMRPQQIRSLATLSPGEAIAFSQNEYSPVLIKVPYEHPLKSTSELKARVMLSIDISSQRLIERNRESYEPLGDTLTYAHDGRLEIIRQIADYPKVQSWASRFILSLVAGDRNIRQSFEELYRSISRHSLPWHKQYQKLIAKWVAHRFLIENLGNQGATPQKISALHSSLFAVVDHLTSSANQPYTETKDMTEAWRIVVTEYRSALTSPEPPFDVCHLICPDFCCIYRRTAESLLHNQYLDRLFESTFQKVSSQLTSGQDNINEDAYVELAKYMVFSTKDLISNSTPDLEKYKLALCYANQKMSSSRVVTDGARKYSIQQLIEVFSRRDT